MLFFSTPIYTVVSNFSYNILTNDEDAEACVNDTWMGVWKSIPPQRPNNPATYLGKIMRNLSLNRLKQCKVEKCGGSQTDLALSWLEDCIPSSTTEEESNHR